MAGALPKFYEHWLGTENRGPVETDAFNCASCFMAKPTGRTRDLGPFRESLKCCTFHPFLPSFTIGALLAKGQNVDLENYLAASRLTPLGAFSRVASTSICETGQKQETRCDFLSKDSRAVCTIRDYRPSTCAGYVCRSNDGERGLKSWRNWEASIAKFEWSLAHLAAFELGFVLGDVENEFSSIGEACVHYGRAFEVSGDIAYVED